MVRCMFEASMYVMSTFDLALSSTVLKFVPQYDLNH